MLKIETQFSFYYV